MLPVCGILIKATDDNQTKARFLFVSSDRYVSAKKKKKKGDRQQRMTGRKTERKGPSCFGRYKKKL